MSHPGTGTAPPAHRAPRSRAALVLTSLGALLVATSLAAPTPAAAQQSGGPTGTTPGGSVTFAGGGVQPVTPARLLDTRASGSTVDGAFQGDGAVGADRAVSLLVAGRGGVPTVGVGAAVLNVTVTRPARAGHLTVHPTGSDVPNASNLNYAAGQTAPNLVLAKLGTAGRVQLVVSAQTHVLVDVVGWLPEGRDVQTLQPARVLDTRAVGRTVDGQAQAAGALRAGEARRLVLAGRGGVPAAGAGAVVLNLTAVGPSRAGFLTAHPSGSPRPNASTLNFAPGAVTPNLVVAKLGADGAISVYNSAGTTSVLADVVGWMPEVADFTALAPARLLDTRRGALTTDGQQQAGGPVAAGESRRLPVAGRGGVPATGAGSVVLNVTATGPTTTTHVTAFPSGTTAPEASNLNVARGGTRANLVVAQLGGDGAVSLRNAAGAVHLIADVVGWFPAAGAGATRMDLRSGTVLGGAGDALSATGDSETGATVVLAPSADVPAVGGHLVLSPQAQAPSGLSGRVTEATAVAGGTRVTLAPADLQDMFTDLDVEEDLTGHPDIDLDDAAAASGQRGARSAKCGPTAGTSAPGVIDPPRLSLGSIGGHFELDLSERYSRLKMLSAPTARWTTPAGAGVSCSFTIPAVTVFVGALAIELSLKITASSSVKGSVTVTARSPLTLGYIYDRGDATSLNNARGLLEVTEVTSDGGEMRLGAAAVLSAKYLGVLGVQGDFGPAFRAVYDTSGCGELRFGISIGLAGVLGRWGVDWKFDLLRYDLADSSLGQIGTRNPDGTCSTPRPSPSPSPPPAPRPPVAPAAGERPLQLRITQDLASDSTQQLHPDDTKPPNTASYRESTAVTLPPLNVVLDQPYRRVGTPFFGGSVDPATSPLDAERIEFVATEKLYRRADTTSPWESCTTTRRGLAFNGNWGANLRIETADHRSLDQARPGETVHVRIDAGVAGASTRTNAASTTEFDVCAGEQTGTTTSGHGLLPLTLDPQIDCPAGTVRFTFRTFTMPLCAITGTVAGDGSLTISWTGRLTPAVSASVGLRVGARRG